MRRTSMAVVGLMALGLTLLAACSGSSGQRDARDATSSTGPSSAARPVPLSLLVFNVEYGGTPASDAVIADLHADVVGVLESYNRLPTIAKAAGYPYYDVGLQIMSKYPILEPSGANGLYSYIEVAPGQAVAMINTHLDYVQDGPNRLNRGVPVPEVLQAEDRIRLSTIDKLIPSATRLLSEGWPLLLTGDLNEPSHLDWIPQTASQHRGIGAVAWPVSKALIDAGLHDSYRVAHPDPVTDPGNTWGGVAGNGGSPRRIDYAYVGGKVDVVSSEVIGERGGNSVDKGYAKWTSDHRAVLSQLDVTPVPIPTTIALSSRMVTAGSALTASYVLPHGTDHAAVTLTGPSTASYDVKGGSGTVPVDTSRLAAGDYRVDLHAGSSVVATNQLHIRPRNARVVLTTDASTYRTGQPISVHWSDGPANRWDWIGVYRAGAANPAKDSYTIWGYTGGHDAGALPPTAAGSLVLGSDHQGHPWPLPKGHYVVHYLLTDQYTSVGQARFTVR